MNLCVPILSALLLAASSAAYAQAPKGFDCSRVKDPKGCEERMAKMREARDQARKACQGKSGDERRECMEKSFCANAKEPAKCEANLKERAQNRRELREACKGKKGDELKSCIREHRAANRK